MKEMTTSSKAWAGFYKDLKNPVNFYPENFVTRIFFSEKPIKFLEKKFNGKRILDLGCGHGRHIPFLQSLGFEVEGLEVSAEQVQSLSRQFPELLFQHGTCAAIPVENLRYDYILACNSIYYTDNTDPGFSANITECLRVLRPGGYLIFSMIGKKHSILKGRRRESDHAILAQDFLGFRQGTIIRPLWNKGELPVLMSPFSLLRSGEILENAEGTCRHLHYAVAQKPMDSRQ